MRTTKDDIEKKKKLMKVKLREERNRVPIGSWQTT